MGWATPRVEIADPRDRHRHLRVAWHASKSTIVVSQWRSGICVASTPVEVSQVPDLITLLVEALGEAARPTGEKHGPPTPQTIRRDLSTLVGSRLRPRLAPIIALSAARRKHRPGSDDQ